MSSMKAIIIISTNEFPGGGWRRDIYLDAELERHDFFRNTPKKNIISLSAVTMGHAGNKKAK